MPPVLAELESEDLLKFYRFQEVNQGLAGWVGGVKKYNEMKKKKEISLMPGAYDAEVNFGNQAFKISFTDPTLVKDLNTQELIYQFPWDERHLDKFNSNFGGYYGLEGEYDQGESILTVHEQGMLNNRRRNVCLHTGKTEFCAGEKIEPGKGVFFDHVVGRLFGAMCLAEGSTYSSIRGSGNRIFIARGKNESDVVAAIPKHMFGKYEGDTIYYPAYGDGLARVIDIINQCSKKGLVTGVIGVK